jgi:co-chaperonin GroES (HSP10)
MQWKCAIDRVLVDVPPPPKETASGIVIPDRAATGSLRTGTVLAAGPQARNVKPGDVVYFVTKQATLIESGPGSDVISVSAEYVYAIKRS